MPFNVVHAHDNKHPEKHEASRQRERDRINKKAGVASTGSSAQQARDQAEIQRQAAQEAEATHRVGDQNAIEEAAKQGRGPAGLNTGPSDTRSADPHNPISGQPIYNPGRSLSDDGMGRSPPQGAAPQSDEGPHRVPAVERANMLGSDEAKSQADAANKETQQARQDKQAALEARTAAERQIADGQSEGVGDQARRQANPAEKPSRKRKPSRSKPRGKK